MCYKNYMRKLGSDKRTAVISALAEGCGVNSVARMVGVSKLTVLRLLADVGQLCQDHHDLMVRRLHSKRIQVDECWSFVGAKQKNVEKGKAGHGDAWVWVGLDADSKLVVSYLVGPRNAASANEFIGDIAERLLDRVQLTSDGLHVYLDAVESAFGSEVVSPC